MKEIILTLGIMLSPVFFASLSIPIAQFKNRSNWKWFFIVLIFNILGLIVLLFLPKVKPTGEPSDIKALEYAMEVDPNIKIKELLYRIKYLLISYAAFIGFPLLFFLIISKFEIDISATENEQYLLIFIVIFSIPIILLHISNYRIAKALNENAAAWLFANIAFTFVLFVSPIYFGVKAMTEIIRLKFSKKRPTKIDAQPSSAKGSPGHSGF